MKQLTLFDYPPTRDEIPGDLEPDRYGRGQKKNKSIQYDEDDPKYIAPLLKNDSPKPNQHHKLTFGESKKQGNSKPFTDAYYPRGTARGNHKYFRLLYKSKSGKWKEKHICGGNINLKVAIEKRKAIDEAIAQNEPIKILLEMCK